MLYTSILKYYKRELSQGEVKSRVGREVRVDTKVRVDR
jgi:hypothetical protein